MFKYLYLSLYILNLQLFKSINSAIICTGSSTFFCQNIAYYCIGQHCLLSSQMTVVNMPQFRKGERLKLIAHGTVSGWTPDEIKTISTAANPLSTGCWANQQLNDMWKMDHVLDHPVWLTNRMMHLLWDKHIIHNSSCPPQKKIWEQLIAQGHHNVSVQTFPNHLHSGNRKALKPASHTMLTPPITKEILLKLQIE